jgi:hypothetical protein
VLSQGPIPAVVHGAIEYAAAALLILAPFLFAFDSGGATAASLVLGLLVLVFTATSALPTGLVKGVPASLHVVGDLVLAVLLVALPFILGFRAETAPTAVFISLGVAHVVITIGTRFPDGRGVRR